MLLAMLIISAMSLMSLCLVTDFEHLHVVKCQSLRPQRGELRFFDHKSSGSPFPAD